MITKERLEELIEQGAFIFYILNNSVAILRLNNSYGISVEEYNKEHNCKPQFYHSGYVYQNICDADKIFETEEDARWELEMTATRTETLKLPTWEWFYNSGKSIVFRDAYGDIQELKQFSGEIYINGQYCGFLAKENYIKACKFCLRLFKGEEV